MFEGSLVALVTPFDAAGEIDYRALDSLVSRHLDAGTDGLVVAGTTGESATLREHEIPQLLAAVVGQVAGQIPVIAGIGHPATERSVQNARVAAEHGADAVLVVTPSYNRPTQPGLEAHFRAIADSSDIPLILYNVPARTSVDMLPTTVAALSRHERIVAIKEAVGQMERVQSLRAECGPEFTILSGDDPTFLQAMRHGARGVISVAANVAPRAFSRICAAALRGDWIVAEQEESRLRPLFQQLAVQTNPIPVKWALHEMALCHPGLRLPLLPLSEQHRQGLRRCLESLNLVHR